MTKRVLIVDDEVAILLALKKLLQSPEVEIDTVVTLQGAKNLLQQQDYDVVITDLRLTGVLDEEGLEILRYIKEHHPHTKVILVTGYGNSELKKRAYAMGADYYFEKPVSTDVLKDALKKLGIYYKEDS